MRIVGTLLIAIGGSAFLVRLYSMRSIPAARVILPPVPYRMIAKNPGDIVSIDIPIGNAGLLPLRYKLNASCGCTELTPREGVLDPGHTKDIHVGVRLDSEGQEKSILISVNSNDPKRPIGEIRLNGRCLASCVLEPGSLDFGEIAIGGSKDMEFRVLGPPHDPHADFGEIIIKDVPDQMKFQRISSHPGDVRYRVRFQASEKAQSFSGSMHLELSGLKRETVATWSARVIGAVDVSPATIFRFPKDGGGENYNVFIRSRLGRIPGRLIDFSAPKGVSVERIGTAGANPVRVSIRVSKSAALSASEVLSLKFEGIDDRVRIMMKSVGDRSSTMIDDSSRTGSPSTRK
jgi:hypothetical protein